MRSKMILLLALVMSLITTVLFFNYMNQFDAQKTSNETMVEVVAAKEKIFENQSISAEMLETVVVPLKGVHPQAIKNISDAEGKYVTTDIEKGEIILAHRVKNQEEETSTLSYKVQDGYRAVSVGLNVVQSVSNLIEAEDFVDIILTEVWEENGRAFTKTEQILSKVRVLAVGQKMVDSSNSTASAPSENGSEQRVEYSSITLELKQEDSILLVNASQKGSIHLTLHPKILSARKEKN